LIQKIGELEKGVEIVVNDYGVLHACQQLEHINFVIGHFLSTTYEASPWFDLMISQENEFVKRVCSENFMNDSHLTEFLKKLGVVGIESELLPNVLQSLREIRSRGLHVGVLLDFVPVTFSRVCHTRRFRGLAPPECSVKCNYPIKLQITHYREWWIPGAKFKEIRRELRERIPEMYAFGNVVYRKTLFDLNENYDFIDYAILDTKFYSLDELSERLKHIVELS
jgi:hypothetical protein